MQAATVKRGHIEFPADWKHVESRGSGPFTTRVVHQLADGSTHIWSSRRHRKGFGPEIVTPEGEAQAKKRPSLFLWAPDKLNWWIAVLFMIGSFGFILGSVLFLVGFENDFLIGLIFFIGSIFFTSAGYAQYNQSINAETAVGVGQETPQRKWLAWQPDRLDFWVTFSQLLGTIMFNFNTFDAYLKLGWLGQDLAIWVPDMVGSILFQISGTLAVVEICHRWWCWQSRNLTWWITMINFVGCVAFLISAFLAFVRPDPLFDNVAIYATIFTLIGAVCFFVGAYLMWPEMSIEAKV
jgi:hypothetical protein